MRDDGASASTESASARSCATSDPSSTAASRSPGGRDARGDERAPRAVRPHAVQAEGESARNAAHPRRSLDS